MSYGRDAPVDIVRSARFVGRVHNRRTREGFMSLGRFRSSVLAVGLAGMLGVLTVVPGLAASSTVTVTPATLALDATSWYFYNDVNNQASTAEDPAHYKFVSGPGTPPAGVGSIFFHNDVEPLVPTNLQQRWNIATRRFAGTKLVDLTALKFNTYEPTGEAPDAIFLNFDVSFGVTPPAGYQGRLSYVPRQNGTVLANTWQEWDAASSGALWSWSGYGRGPDKISGTPDDNTWPDGNTSSLRAWSAIKIAFPNATMNNPDAPGFGQLVFRSGEPYPTGFTGYLDKVTVGVSNGDTTTFDFEPTVGPPTDKDQCKGDGWKQFNTPKFKNQGDCVSYTNKG
jgi:hypothetical protein